ncbi:endolytic transglycosylase MltG [Pseudomonadota bacterium]
MKRALTLVTLIALIGLIAGGGGFFYVKGGATRPGPHHMDVRLRIIQGQGMNSIANQLRAERVITDPLIFRLWARYTNQHTRLRAGEFNVPARASMAEILSLLERGKTVVHKMTLAEGVTVAEALAMIEAIPALEGHISAIPADGQLLPETYHYSWGDDRNALVKRMTGAMKELVREQWNARPDGFILQSPNDLVTLASIVEKETGVAHERPKVAAVFFNRLRKGMRLQSDPTVVYALTNGSGPLGRALTREDLKIESPYNTYRIKGLPPAPIANPGRDAILAVMNPADTDALYFVADGSGGHVFARTLKEHNRNVAKWRKLKRQNGK